MLIETRRRALRALIPPPRLRLSEWVESHMRLPEGVSALPGRVNLWPYQREIADAISDPELERVTLVKPVRVGFTTLLTGALASYVANEPSPILALLPTEADCRDYVVSDLEPIFEATPSLRGMLSADADETGRNTLLSRRFSVTPKTLLVGPELETKAEKLLTTINATNTDDVNPFGGKLSLAVEPRITDDSWYVFADPATVPVLEYSYLSSAPGPQMSSREGWEVLSVEYRVYLDFGAGAIDWRGVVRNPGV